MILNAFGGVFLAIYHLTTKSIAREGYTKSGVAALAYRAGVKLFDHILNKFFDYTKKSDVADVSYLCPENAPDWYKKIIESDDKKTEKLQKLSDIVEAHEKRSDSRVYREIECSLPKEFTLKENKNVARDFFKENIESMGLGGILSIHDCGKGTPHVHALLFTRPFTEDGFGKKELLLDSKDFLKDIRKKWAEHINIKLKDAGIDASIDHRSYKDQGVELKPMPKLGSKLHKSILDGKPIKNDRYKLFQNAIFENQRLLMKDPSLVLSALMRNKAIATKEDIDNLIGRYFGEKDTEKLSERVVNDLNTVAIGDGFVSRSLIIENQEILEMAKSKENEKSTIFTEIERNEILEKGTEYGAYTDSQKKFVSDVLEKEWVNAVGFAGTGKTAALLPICDALKEKGVEILGLAPTGKAAEGLRSAGIRAITIHSFLYRHKHGMDQKSHKNQMIILDEAGMVGTNLLHSLLKIIHKEDRKFIILGDPKQLQPIEAGRPFKDLVDENKVELSKVVRQNNADHRAATEAMGRGDMKTALNIYKSNIHMHKESEKAIVKGIFNWYDKVKDEPKDHLLLAHTNEYVESMNNGARVILKSTGVLKGEVMLSVKKVAYSMFGLTKAETTEKGFSENERIIFLKNDKKLGGIGVMNGTMGTIKSIKEDNINAVLDCGKEISFDPKSYSFIDHGYATTIHKAQGMTAKTTTVIAQKSMNLALAYVALSRHKDDVKIYANEEDFKKHSLRLVFSRQEQKNNYLKTKVHMPTEKDKALEKLKNIAISKLFEIKSKILRPEIGRGEDKNQESSNFIEKVEYGVLKALGEYEKMQEYKSEKNENAREEHTKDLNEMLKYSTKASPHSDKEREIILHAVKEEFTKNSTAKDIVSGIVVDSEERTEELLNARSGHAKHAFETQNVSMEQARMIGFIRVLGDANGKLISGDDAKEMAKNIEKTIKDISKEVSISDETKSILSAEIAEKLVNQHIFARENNTHIKKDEEITKNEKENLSREDSTQENHNLGEKDDWVQKAKDLETKKMEKEIEQRQMENSRSHQRGMDM